MSPRHPEREGEQVCEGKKTRTDGGEEGEMDGWIDRRRGAGLWCTFHIKLQEENELSLQFPGCFAV